MRTETLKVYLYRRLDGPWAGELHASDFELDSNESRLFLASGEATFSIEISAEEELQAQIDGLKKDIQTVRGAAQAKVADLEARIQSLLSITHQAEEA